MAKPELFMEREGYGKKWHFSLHASGQWHMKESGKERVTWTKPAEVVPGYTRAVGIVQPVVVAHREDPAPNGVEFVPVAPDAEPTVFSVFIERLGANMNGWPGRTPTARSLSDGFPSPPMPGRAASLPCRRRLRPAGVELPRPSDDELRHMREWAVNGVLAMTIVGEMSDGAIALIDLRADSSDFTLTTAISWLP
jgi:hypothetical protein